MGVSILEIILAPYRSLESSGRCGEGSEDGDWHSQDRLQAGGFSQRSLCQEAGE